MPIAWWLVVASVPLAYVAMMGWLWWGWLRLQPIRLSSGVSTQFTVVVPARNEAHNLSGCLESILAQDYPPHLFEIIVVDDHSEDATAQVAASFADRGVRVLSLATLAHAPCGKKAALREGVARASGSWIITTDADCVVPPLWLRHFDAAIREAPRVSVGSAVLLTGGSSMLTCFQQLDFLGTMGLTGAGIAQGGPYLANGASFAFDKAAFLSVGGYSGIDHLASGDDVLLLHKLARYCPGCVGWIKNARAAVYTFPQPNWRALWQQRRRWASKAHAYSDGRLAMVQVLVFGLSLQIVLGAAAAFMGWVPWEVCYVAFGAKAIVDSSWLWMLARHFGQSTSLSCLLPALVLHVIYVLVAGGSSFWQAPYIWKERLVR